MCGGFPFDIALKGKQTKPPIVAGSDYRLFGSERGIASLTDP
jgi:hypothetical protein